MICTYKPMNKAMREMLDGELYACYGEFCDCEQQDRAYMKKLLGKLEYERYKEMM